MTKISASGLATGIVVTGYVTLAIPYAEFSAVRFCSYIARNTIGLLTDSYALVKILSLAHSPLKEIIF